jgi:hypothetical protein
MCNVNNGLCINRRTLNKIEYVHIINTESCDWNITRVALKNLTSPHPCLEIVVHALHSLCKGHTHVSAPCQTFSPKRCPASDDSINNSHVSYLITAQLCRAAGLRSSNIIVDIHVNSRPWLLILSAKPWYQSQLKLQHWTLYLVSSAMIPKHIWWSTLNPT